MQDSELNRILDNALPGYSGATPLDGLEQRVLNRIGRASRKRSWLHYLEAAVALAAVSSLVIAAFWLLAPKSEPPAAAARAGPASVAYQSQPAPLVTKRERPSRHIARPKQDQFPSSAPLSGEERSLLALAKRAPETVTNASAEIDIPLIQIPPLQSDGSQ